MIKAMRGEEVVKELREKSGKVVHHSLKEVAELDPFERRARAIVAEGEALLGDEAKPSDKFLAGIEKEVDTIFGKEKSIDIDALRLALEPFLADTFQKWYSSDKTFTQPEQTPSLAIPSDLDLPSLKADTDPAKFGEYTLNPECIGINYETVAITTKDITRDKGYLALPNKDLATVAKYIIDTYSTKYILPDLSFYQWVIENPTKAPQELKDGNWHFTFGSVLRNRVGVVLVPLVYWVGSEFYRNAYRLDYDWFGDYRVVLLER